MEPQRFGVNRLQQCVVRDADGVNIRNSRSRYRICESLYLVFGSIKQAIRSQDFKKIPERRGNNIRREPGDLRQISKSNNVHGTSPELEKEKESEKEHSRPKERQIRGCSSIVIK